VGHDDRRLIAHRLKFSEGYPVKSLILCSVLALCLPLSVLGWEQPFDYALVEAGHSGPGGLGLKFSDYDYAWSNVAFKLGKELPHRLRVEATLELGFHTVSRPAEREGVSLAGALWLDRDFGLPNTSADLFVGIGGGLGTLHPAGNQPLLGNSGVIGLLRAHVGLRWRREKRILSVALYTDHISDPFHEGSQDGSTDWGRNTLGIALGWGRRF